MKQFAIKRMFVILLFISALTVFPLSAQAAQEAQAAAGTVTARMGVMQGPSGFGSIGLRRDDGKIGPETVVDLSVYPSPNEVIARLANGDLDIAALPTNVAANLYAKGVPVKTAAIVGEGMLMLLTTDDTIDELDDLAGRTIAIPGAGGTPDQITRILVTALGYDPESDVLLDYSIAAPAQVAQMLIAGRVDLAVLPEPFVSLALNSNDKVVPLLDLQVLWSALTGSGNYPMTVAVVSDAFAQAHPEQLKRVMDALEASVAWVNEHPAEAGALIEQEGIMKASMAVPAIPRCNLVFRTASEGREAMDHYLQVLYGFDYQSIGGVVPDESFYLDY